VEASETTTQPGAAPEGADPAAAATPDVTEQFAQLEKRLDTIADRLPAEEQQEQPGDLFDTLYGDSDPYSDDPNYGLDPEYGGPVQPGAEQQPQGGEQPEQAEAMAAVQQFISEQVAAQLEPHLAAQEEHQRRAALNDFAQQHPDVKDPQVLQHIAGQLRGVAEIYGDAAYTDPRLVEAFYKSYKADAAAAAETPAEVAGQPGAVLETGTGPSQPSSGEGTTPEQRIKEAIFGGAASQDVFT
jgi:hypothetical protein